MQLKKFVIINMVLFLASGISWAADYKDWLAHIPDELDGVKATSRGDGINLNTGDMKMSSLVKTYGDGDKQMDIVIMSESSGEQVQAQKAMRQIKMETDDYVNKSIKIQGFDAIYQDDKTTNSVNIIVLLNDSTMLTFGANGGKSEKHYIDLLDEVNLKKISENH